MDYYCYCQKLLRLRHSLGRRQVARIWQGFPATAAAAIIVGVQALGVPFTRDDRRCSNCKRFVVHTISDDDDISVVLRVAGPAGVGVLITLAGGY